MMHLLDRPGHPTNPTVTPRRPSWERPVLSTLALVVLLLPGAAHAQRVLFDFEGPYLLDPGRTIKDHALVHDDSTQTWHVFYIRGEVGAPGTSSETQLGHATSANLRRWSVLPPVIESQDGSFDARNTWAPEVVRNENDDGWTMYYTGRDGQFLQRTGRADTADLFDWEKLPANPILEPDSTVYLWSPDLAVPELSSFRDPFFLETDGAFHLLHTALVPDSTLNAGRRGVVHHFESTDRQNWVDVGPLAVSNSPQGAWRDIESIQLIEHQGTWTMFFTLFNVQGVQYIQSEQFDVGWDFSTAQELDFGIAAEFHPLEPGSWIYTRHLPAVHLPPHPQGGEIFYTLRADTLRFDPDTGEPVVVPTDPLGPDWIEETGTAFLAAPTFGDNQRERGEPGIGAYGHGYLSSREFYNGPLGVAGSLGAQLGNEPVGTMTSRWFTIEPTDSLITFRIAGTEDPGCRVELVQRVAADPDSLVIVRSTTPGGTRTMTSDAWDVRDLRGAEVRVEVIDESPDGYIALDHFRTLVDPVIPTAAPPRRSSGRIERVAPNPFNPRTSIEFTLDRRQAVQLLVHDLRGRRVRTFDRGRLDAGTHRVVWDGTDDTGHEVASGVYLVRLVGDDGPGPGRKLTLVR